MFKLLTLSLWCSAQPPYRGNSFWSHITSILFLWSPRALGHRWKFECRLHGKLRVLASSSAAPLTTEVQYNICITTDATPNLPVHLTLHFIVIHEEEDPKTFKLFHLGQQLTPNPDGTICRFLAEHQSLRLGGWLSSQLLHTRLQTSPVRAEGHVFVHSN